MMSHKTFLAMNNGLCSGCSPVRMLLVDENRVQRVAENRRDFGLAFLYPRQPIPIATCGFPNPIKELQQSVPNRNELALKTQQFLTRKRYRRLPLHRCSVYMSPL